MKQISGVFTACKFQRANFYGARMSGYFTRCDFRDSILTDVDWTGGRFVDCIFDEGEGPPENQRETEQEQG